MFVGCNSGEPPTHTRISTLYLGSSLARLGPLDGSTPAIPLDMQLVSLESSRKQGEPPVGRRRPINRPRYGADVESQRTYWPLDAGLDHVPRPVFRCGIPWEVPREVGTRLWKCNSLLAIVLDCLPLISIAFPPETANCTAACSRTQPGLRRIGRGNIGGIPSGLRREPAHPWQSTLILASQGRGYLEKDLSVGAWCPCLAWAWSWSVPGSMRDQTGLTQRKQWSTYGSRAPSKATAAKPHYHQ